MYVRLKADGSVAGKGFSANYSWVTTVRYILDREAIVAYIQSSVKL